MKTNDYEEIGKRAVEKYNEITNMKPYKISYLKVEMILREIVGLEQNSENAKAEHV